MIAFSRGSIGRTFRHSDLRAGIHWVLLDRKRERRKTGSASTLHLPTHVEVRVAVVSFGSVVNTANPVFEAAARVVGGLSGRAAAVVDGATATATMVAESACVRQ